MFSSIICGLVVGALARFVKPGADSMGWIMTIILGMVGASVGGYIARTIGISTNGMFMNLGMSVLGAVIVLFIYEIVTGKRKIG